MTETEIYAKPYIQPTGLGAMIGAFKPQHGKDKNPFYKVINEGRYGKPLINLPTTGGGQKFESLREFQDFMKGQSIAARVLVTGRK